MLSRYPSLKQLHDDLNRLDVDVRSRGLPPAKKRVEEGKDTTRVSLPWIGQFFLTGAQRDVVRILLDAMSSRHPEIEELVLLRRSRATVASLAELFRGSPAWGTLVVRGSRAGVYRIPEPPVCQQEDEIRVIPEGVED